LSAKEPYVSTQETGISEKEPYLSAKVPDILQRSPVSLQKSPMSPHKRLVSQQKSPISPQKSPISPQKSPISPQKSPIFLQDIKLAFPRNVELLMKSRAYYCKRALITSLVEIWGSFALIQGSFVEIWGASSRNLELLAKFRAPHEIWSSSSQGSLVEIGGPFAGLFCRDERLFPQKFRAPHEIWSTSHGEATSRWQDRYNNRSLLQKSLIKETIFCKRDESPHMGRLRVVATPHKKYGALL
jgi:hypothetical protein